MKRHKPPGDRGRQADRIPPKPVVPSLRPRRQLLVVLSILFTIWVIFLLALYFGTVWPVRSQFPQ